MSDQDNRNPASSDALDIIPFEPSKQLIDLEELRKSQLRVICAAFAMDRWTFKSSNAKRFRRLVKDGMPIQELHEALKALDNVSQD